MRWLIALSLIVFPAQALDLSGLEKPGVTWHASKAKTADVTCDGKPDTVAFGTGKDAISVAVLPGKGGKPQIMKFGIGAARQDNFCAVPTHIELEPISCSDPEIGKFPGCKPVKGCQQFSVVDDQCDSFHFYWDSKKKMVHWWRR
ncbi:MAG: hypothetical protein U1E93_07080 [Alphaproteobacteria bacterium]